MFCANGEIKNQKEQILEEKYENSNPETDKVISEDRQSKQEKNMMIQNEEGWRCRLYASKIMMIYVWFLKSPQFQRVL
jgi:hypothetical protein